MGNNLSLLLLWVAFLLNKWIGNSALSVSHIINLVGETWQHYKYFSDATSLVTWMRSVFFEKPARKQRWVAFLINKECVQATVPLEAVCTRWNSWFEAVRYHAAHVHLYRQFLLAESTGMAIKKRKCVCHLKKCKSISV